MKHRSQHEAAAVVPGVRSRGSSLGERAVYLFALVCLIAGIAIGYLLRGITSQAPASLPASPAAANQAPQASLDSIAEPVEAALKADPKNAKLLIQLGNLYYDHRAYTKAITYYQHALEVEPRNVSVRTDLGTAYVYSGLPKQAVAEYQKALAIDPRHLQALFNLGVVYETGLKDHSHAIAAWEKVLKFYPQNPERGRVESLIEKARSEQAASKTP